MENFLVQALAVGAIGSLGEARPVVRASSALKTNRAGGDVEAVYATINLFREQDPCCP